MTSGSLVFGSIDKIFKLKDGRILVGAGVFDIGPAIAIWLEGGEKPVLKGESEWYGLILERGKQALTIDDDLRIAPACIPWAGGSGEQIALAAMTLGKSPKEAVELACKLDIYTGGKVRTYKI